MDSLLGDSTESNLTYRPFPVDVLPQPIRGFVAAAADAIGCDAAFVALPMLAALASAIGNTRRLRVKNSWDVPPVLWTAVVSESGTAKTPAARLVMTHVHRQQAAYFRDFKEEMARYDEAIAEWKIAEAQRQQRQRQRDDGDDDDDPRPERPTPPTVRRNVVSDTTVEALAAILANNPRGVLLARDELAGWFGSFDRYANGKAGADASAWLSMYSAESFAIDRKTGIPPTIHVPQAAVCVTGGIQPGILQRALTAAHRESGLAARLMMAYPPRKKKEWTDDDIDPRHHDALARILHRLYGLNFVRDDDGRPAPLVVRLDAEARAAWIEHYAGHNHEALDHTGDMAAAWSKLEEIPARLALVFHCVRYEAGEPVDPMTLDATSMNAGIAMGRWFSHEARRIYGMLAETKEERSARKLLEWIRARGGSATAREAQQGCRWLRQSGLAEKALTALVASGMGQWESVPPTTHGGPATRRFLLHRVYETPLEPGENIGSVDRRHVDTTGDDPFWGAGTSDAGPYDAGF